jgi:hydroxymethylglutaryl-CoA lyase
VRAGAEELILADTVGYGDPASVRKLFSAVQKDVGDVPIKAHFHDTRGLGLANALSALEVGIRMFDASLGGLGGCPYAPGASGNIATEDLVFMLESMGLRTGVDLDRLLAVREGIRKALPDQPFHGTIAKAGVPKYFRSLNA